MAKQEKRKEGFGQTLYGMFGMSGQEKKEESAPVTESVDDLFPIPEAEPEVEPEAVPADEPKPQEPAPFVDAAVPPRRENTTYFAAGTSIEGVLRSDSDVEIVGDFSGEIMSDGKVIIHANTVSSIAAKELELVGSTLAGNVTVSGEVKLDGASSVTGNIRAGSVESRGTIKGNIAAQEDVALKDRANVQGDIKSAVLSVDRGVKLNGRVEMGQ